MLILSRKIGEVIRINGDIEIKVIGGSNGSVRLGITAPPEVAIVRAELLDSAAGTVTTAQ